MTSSSFSTIHSTTHRQPHSGLVATLVLFSFEGMYELVGGLAKASKGNLDAIQGWLNLEQLTQSGRYKHKLAPT